MALNYIWIGFFLIAFVVGFIRLFMGDYEVIPAMFQSTFDMSKVGFELSLYLTGIMTLWLGIMVNPEVLSTRNIIWALVAVSF